MKKIFRVFIFFLIFAAALEGMAWLVLRLSKPPVQVGRLKSQSWTKVKEGNPSLNPLASQLFTTPLSVTRHDLRPSGHPPTVATYTADSYGLRETKSPEVRKEKHLLVSGCSFTFGFGVRDEETLVYRLAHSFPSWNVKNLAYPGGGLHKTLRFFELVNPKEYAPEDEGILVHVMISAHVERWNQDWSYFLFNNGDAPAYKRSGDDIVYSGKVRDHYRARIARQLHSFSLGRLLFERILDRAPPMGTEEINFYLDGVSKLKRIYLSRYPKGRFALVFHPQLYRTYLGKMIAQGAKDRGIEFHDAYPDFIRERSGPWESYVIPGDSHPSGKLYAYLADWMSKKIISKTDG